MMLLRSAQEHDFLQIEQLSKQAGIGLTSLPQDKRVLRQRLYRSIQSFEKSIAKPHDEYYMFVFEDVARNKIVGTAAIEASTGFDSPFYSYHISKRSRICYSLHIRNDYELLTLSNDNQNKTEICGLYLDQDYRRHGNGSLLSRARFLFIAQFPARFTNQIIAEMRGISDSSGRSPFWDHVGRHFFHMNFAEADRLSITTNKQFITDLMPNTPLYIKLLAPSAQAAVGKPHPSTVSAMNILHKEGFRFNNHVDIFDAGPILEVEPHALFTIAHHQLLEISHIHNTVNGEQYIIANTDIDFRATMSQVLIDSAHKTCMINREAATLLQVDEGDMVRIVKG